MSELMTYKFTAPPKVDAEPLTEAEHDFVEELSSAIVILENGATDSTSKEEKPPTISEKISAKSKIASDRSSALKTMEKEKAKLDTMFKEKKISAEDYHTQKRIIENTVKRVKEKYDEMAAGAERNEQYDLRKALNRAYNPVYRTMDRIEAKINSAYGKAVQKHEDRVKSTSDTMKELRDKATIKGKEFHTTNQKQKAPVKGKAGAVTESAMDEVDGLSIFIEYMIESELESLSNRDVKEGPHTLESLNKAFNKGTITRAEYTESIKKADNQADVKEESVETMIPQVPVDKPVLTKTFESANDFMKYIVESTFGNFERFSKEGSFYSSVTTADTKLAKLTKLFEHAVDVEMGMDYVLESVSDIVGDEVLLEATENSSNGKLNSVNGVDEMKNLFSRTYGGYNKFWGKMLESAGIYYESNVYLTEAANIDKDMKPIIEKLNKKGYKTKNSCAGHPGSFSKKDTNHDNVSYGRRYSYAHIMFDGNYNFPGAPKHWYFRTVDGKDYLDIREPHVNDAKQRNSEDGTEWKDKYMDTLKTWVDNLPSANDSEDIHVDKKGTKDDVVTESVSEAMERTYEEMMLDLSL